MRGLFALILFFASQSFADGFSNGNDFTVTPLSGQVFIHCQDNTTQFTRCYAELFDPAESDFFLGPQGIDADSVSLKCQRQDRSVEVKSSSYDSKQGRSSKRFNLWINTLLQTPLLEMGVNQVSYDLLKSGKSVAKGQFTATVTEGPGITCQSGHVWSIGAGIDYCQNNYSACQRYFDENNYCQ